MKKNCIVFILFLLVFSITGCSTFRNIKDLEYIDSEEYTKIGEISTQSLTWSWTNFSSSGNSKFNNKLYSKLYKKAVKKYGTDIDLYNVVISDSVGANVGIHAGSLISGTALAYLLNDTSKMNDPDYQINTIYGLAYLPTLCKLVKISADVVRNDTGEIISGDFISEDSFNFEYKLEHSGFTDNEKEAIKNKQIFIGMSEDALLMSWGKPNRINSSNYGDGTQYQYCYNNQYVYIKHGVITAWN